MYWHYDNDDNDELDSHTSSEDDKYYVEPLLNIPNVSKVANVPNITSVLNKNNNHYSQNNMVSYNNILTNITPNNTISNNTISNNTISNNTISNNTISNNTISNNTISKKIVIHNKDGTITIKKIINEDTIDVSTYQNGKVISIKKLKFRQN
ncbi:MAG: hypothetical protein Homavirus12_13 [Homavirus sp.]|uniref:Uncharacterized protein n=1 Tax=Homavirus sp. TaxID=2487769 RepID=A0A3G5AA02_9VIRU|nr:MAG: hypothetical protein Homavirus12_13 [Homavirus sp.]